MFSRPRHFKFAKQVTKAGHRCGGRSKKFPDFGEFEAKILEFACSDVLSLPLKFINDREKLGQTGRLAVGA